MPKGSAIPLKLFINDESSCSKWSAAGCVAAHDARQVHESFNHCQIGSDTMFDDSIFARMRTMRE